MIAQLYPTTTTTPTHPLQKWLERTPGLHPDEFDFWSKYQEAVRGILAANRSQVDKADLTPETRQAVLSECEKNELSFQSVFDLDKHTELRDKGERRLSHKAMQGAIMIFLYRCVSDLINGFVPDPYVHSLTFIFNF